MENEVVDLLDLVALGVQLHYLLWNLRSRGIFSLPHSWPIRRFPLFYLQSKAHPGYTLQGSPLHACSFKWGLSYWVPNFKGKSWVSQSLLLKTITWQMWKQCLNTMGFIWRKCWKDWMEKAVAQTTYSAQIAHTIVRSKGKLPRDWKITRVFVERWQTDRQTQQPSTQKNQARLTPRETKHYHFRNKNKSPWEQSMLGVEQMPPSAFIL